MFWIVLLIVAGLVGFAFGWISCEIHGTRLVIGIEFGKLQELTVRAWAATKRWAEQAREFGRAVRQTIRSNTH